MTTQETNKTSTKNPHSVTMENRKNLILSGIKEVNNYDENTVDLYTEMGRLVIKGENLNIKKLNLDFGDLEVDGKISSLNYSNEKSKSGFFSKLFK
ncbi:MAG: sporulation protein YabP [Clostridia bacterium]|nr:sporulation protein YabP [Clostridia bacterium]